MKDRVVRAVFAAAAVLGCGSVGAGTPASAYVQDGLVAQFDGIENAGVGRHDAASTVWVDLIGGHDMTLVEGDSFGDDSCIVSMVKHTCEDDLFAEYATVTYEFNAKPIATTKTASGDWRSAVVNIPNIGAFCWEGKNGGISVIRPQGVDATKLSYQSFGAGYGSAIALMKADFYATYSAIPGAGTTSMDPALVYMNAVQIGKTSGITYNGNDRPAGLALVIGEPSVSSSIRSIRIYNRALAPEEVAHNAAVDRARFDFPEATYTGFRTWTGKGGDADWSTAGNWYPEGTPAAGEFVEIPKGAAVTVSVATAQLGAVDIAGTLTFSGWNSTLNAGVARVTSTGVLTSLGGVATAEDLSRVHLVCTTLTVEKGGSITVNGKGYKAKCGPGWDGVSASGCGGSHGGTGSDGKGKTYGSVTEPTDAGSGGYDVGSYIGQNGGGVVRIEATGAVVVDGSISATGSAGSYNQEAGAGGSVYVACQKILGAGRITADGGGNKTINNATAYVRAVGGGGRISVIYDPVSQATQPCDIAFSARGGADQGGSNQSQLSLFGQEGTLYFSDDAFAKRPLIKLAGRVYYGPEVTHLSSLSYPGDFAPADTLLVFEDGGEIDIGGDLVLTGNIARLYGIVDKGHAPTIRIGGDLVLAGASLRVMDCRTMTVGGDVRFVDGPNGMNRAELYFRAAATNGTDGAYGGVIDVAGDWTMGNYSVYTPSCNGGCGSIVRTTAASLTLTTTAKINANGEGYAGYTGPGKSYSSQDGSTHAGKGAGNSNKPYGNQKHPVTPGSGSGHPNYSSLKGGGVVVFETVGRMTLNGSVTANGVNSPQGNYSGSSAGGSVWLLCGTKLGGTNAVITANAGDSTWTSSSNYKGGGGGYVSIWYQSLSDDVADWTVTARGGMLTREAARTSAWGEDGKTYWRQWHKGLQIYVR